MTTWAKIKAGDRVELRGREYTVERAKRKGKRVKISVSAAGGVFKSEVKATDTVERLEPLAIPLHDKRGAQQRWATDDELVAAHGMKGDPTVTKRPVKPSGDDWATPRDKVEQRLGSILGAHLVGEASDEAQGYYVPPVDSTTIAAHLALFHAVDVSQYGVDDLHELHDTQHESALNGVALAVNHWHTKTRPERQSA